ncbi:LysR family transcriptional regulator [Vibrio sp. T187]|uniref:LysR family transcriptional regulator n=1 Tax=Vibrio TaxID=662 RepID=UPI0010C9B809|nr:MULTISPECIES: LysR family transcriptional regulator [Vibrio]MBW3695087.1 LysR family transcriptional regulator [Vibrio sp. T187]
MKNTIDLNLYRFLDLLYEQKSQAKVCHILDISRATFNRHLADCRDLFANELFIATKGSYAPTLFTTQLMSVVKEPLEQLEQVQQISQSFEGTDSNIEYVFHSANPLSTLLTVPLLKGLTHQGHTPKISMMDWSLEAVEFPKAGTLSVGIAGYPNDLNERIVEKRVGSLELYVYVADSHPLAEFDEVELVQLERYDTVRVSMGTLDSSSYYERLRKRTGVTLDQKLTVASVFSALECVEVSQYIFVCFNMAEDALPSGVKKIPVAFENEKVIFDVGIQYHRACYQHPVIKRIEAILSDCLDSSA